jgi:hypothetical protein
VYFVQFAYRDKKVVGVFVRFRAPLVIDRVLGKSIVELIMPEKYKEISLLGLKFP